MDGKQAINTLKSFHEIMSPEDFDEFIKGADSEKLRAIPEVDEFMKGDKPWDDKDDEGEDKKEEKKEKPGDKKKDKEPDNDGDDEKAVTPELIKGLEDKMTSKFDAVATILKGLGDQGNDDKFNELQKSVDDIASVLGKIAGMPIGTKAVRTGGANFFEKSFGADQEDEEGKKILSVSLHKEIITKSLEDGMSKAEACALAQAYSDSIINYNAGGGQIAKSVAMDLYETYGIRLVK